MKWQYFGIGILGVGMTAVAAMGAEPMAATLRFSSGSLYDYVIIAEHPGATDGFDNAYDTISPGNLNADMGEPYVSSVIIHPEWKGAKEFRGDVRKPARRQEWQVAVTSSLQRGTPLTISLPPDELKIPAGMKLAVVDPRSTDRCDPRSAKCKILAPGKGATATVVIWAEQ